MGRCLFIIYLYLYIKNNKKSMFLNTNFESGLKIIADNDYSILRIHNPLRYRPEGVPVAIFGVFAIKSVGKT